MVDLHGEHFAAESSWVMTSCASLGICVPVKELALPIENPFVCDITSVVLSWGS